MEQILDRIKERIAQRDSPIKTIKGVAEAIGMSESGFYTMIKRGTTKQGTILAIGEALQFELLDLNEEKEKSSKTLAFGDEVLDRMNAEIHEIKQVFEEQLRAKDRQIDNLQRMLESVLGKSEGVTDEPLSAYAVTILDMLDQYKALALGQVQTPAKKVQMRGSKVGGTPFSQAENALVTN